MYSRSPRPKTPGAKTPPPLRPESPTPFPLSTVSGTIFGRISACVSAFELCYLWMTGSKAIQELMSAKGGATHFSLRWRKPAALTSTPLSEKFQGLTSFELVMDLPADWPSLAWNGLQMESLPPKLETLRLRVPEALSVLFLSGPMFSPDSPRYSKRVEYFDFEAHLPALKVLSLHALKSGPSSGNSFQAPSLASSVTSPRQGAAGQQDLCLGGSDPFIPRLPKSLTYLSLFPFYDLSEAFVSSLPSSLTHFSQGYQTTSHEEPISDWKQGFGAGLKSLTLRSPILDLHRWLPRDLTHLDVSQCDCSVEVTSWKLLPRSLTFIGLSELDKSNAKLMSNLPPALTHIYVNSKFEVNEEVAQSLPRSITRLSGHVLFQPESIKHLNQNFQALSFANYTSHGEQPEPVVLPPLPTGLRSLVIKGSYLLDPAIHPLKGLTSLRLEHSDPSVFDPSTLPSSLTTLSLDEQSYILQHLQLSLLPRNLTDLTMSVHHPPNGLFSFDALPDHLSSLQLEIIPLKRKAFSMVKARLARNLPKTLRSLTVSGKYKLFTNEWVEALPAGLVHLHIRPKELTGAGMNESLESKLNSQCFPSLPRKLLTLEIVINDVLNDTALSKLPRGLEKLTIAKSPPSNSIITSNYTNSLPKNVVELVLPQSTSVEYIPLRPYSPARSRKG